MKKVSLFQKAGKTRIIPISVKILVVFILLLLLSNFRNKLHQSSDESKTDYYTNE